MNLKLSRKKLLWIGTALISFYYLLNKFDFIFHSSAAQGVVVAFENNTRMSYSTIQFESGKHFYFFSGEKNVEYNSGEILPVIYLKADPSNAYVFSFLGFWYKGLIFCLVPLMLWYAYVLSFYTEEDTIFLSFFSKKKKNTNLIQPPEKRIE